jgi:hypothetical protein
MNTPAEVRTSSSAAPCAAKVAHRLGDLLGGRSRFLQLLATADEAALLHDTRKYSLDDMPEFS